MLSHLFGHIDHWRGTVPLRAGIQSRALLLTTLLTLWAYRRLLWRDFQFVGNDSDLTFSWIPRMRFSRVWAAAGEPPFWNPFSGLGRPLELGAEHPYSFINLLQRLWSDFDKGLDHSILSLLVLAAVSACGLFMHLGFAPLVGVFGGLLWACSGMVVAQLFAGHVSIFAAFCLAPLFLFALSWSQSRSSVVAAVPAALAFASVLTCGSLQAAHIVALVAIWFFVLRALLGSVSPVAVLSLRAYPPEPRRSGLLMAPGLPWRIRVRELLATLLRLAFVLLMGAHLSHYLWSPMVASGEIAEAASSPLDHSAPGISWLSLFIPHFFLGSGEEYTWVGWASWEGQVGLSSATAFLIALATMSRGRRELLMPVIFTAPLALLALGGSAYSLYARLDPWLACFEVPSRFLFGVNIGLGLAACCGLQAISDQQWEPSPVIKAWFTRIAVGLGLVWIILYYSDGMNPLWQSFQHRLQFGYRFAAQPKQGPAEYYVLFWTRYTAVFALNGALIYSLIRLPRGARPILFLTLLALDVTRIPHAYLNLRASQDFLPAAGLSDVFAKTPAPGRVMNRLQPLWTGTLGMLRFFELSQVVEPRNGESEALREASKLAPDLATLEVPNPLSRLLGVEFYLHNKSLMQDQNWLRRCAGLTNFASPDGDWSITRDNLQTGVLYVSRDFRPVVHWKDFFSALSQPGFQARANQCLLQPRASTELLAIVKRKRFDRLPPLPIDRPESCDLVEVLPNSVQVRCFLKSPGLVVLNQAWSPDWKVSVDLEPESCIPCQLGLARGVIVGPGQHDVRFLYEPDSLTQPMRSGWATLIVLSLGCLAILGLDKLLGWTES